MSQYAAPLPKDRQIELASLAACGDAAAREELILSNMRLVAKVARRYAWSGVPHEDLVQEGVFGLMRAIDRFDASNGCGFWHYAWYWINDAVQSGVARSIGIITMPRSISRLRRKIDIAASRGIDVSCESMGVDRDTMAAAEGFPKIENVAGWSESPSTWQYCDDVEASDEAEHLWRAISLLHPLSQVVIRRRFFGDPESRYGHTYEAIGESLGVDRGTVRDIEKRAIHRLAEVLGREMGIPAAAEPVVPATGDGLGVRGGAGEVHLRLRPADGGGVAGRGVTPPPVVDGGAGLAAPGVGEPGDAPDRRSPGVLRRAVDRRPRGASPVPERSPQDGDVPGVRRRRRQG